MNWFELSCAVHRSPAQHFSVMRRFDRLTPRLATPPIFLLGQTEPCRQGGDGLSFAIWLVLIDDFNSPLWPGLETPGWPRDAMWDSNVNVAHSSFLFESSMVSSVSSNNFSPLRSTIFSYFLKTPLAQVFFLPDTCKQLIQAWGNK